MIECLFDHVAMGGIAEVRPLPPQHADGGAHPGAGVPPARLARPGLTARPGLPTQPELAARPELPSLPVLPALAGLLPRGLERGTVVAARQWSLLCLALAAGASADGAWCAVVGVPQLGVVAAAGTGLDPGRMLLAPDPGGRWPQVVASFLDGCELVLLCPPSRPPAQVHKRLAATLRRSGGVLVVAGDWEGAQSRLTVGRQEWLGAGAGHGRLRARRVQVTAEGRGAAAQPRTQWLWLPGPDGSVSVADPAGIPGQQMRDTG